MWFILSPFGKSLRFSLAVLSSWDSFCCLSTRPNLRASALSCFILAAVLNFWPPKLTEVSSLSLCFVLVFSCSNLSSVQISSGIDLKIRQRHLLFCCLKTKNYSSPDSFCFIFNSLSSFVCFFSGLTLPYSPLPIDFFFPFKLPLYQNW